MTQLNDKSLVKQFAKGAKVTVELGGTPENAKANEKLRASILRDSDKQVEDIRTSTHLSDAISIQR
ncbi:MAG: hypothetical protein MJ250_04995 [Alphaproteobacteria bacterium]|nr:hypothetical protein [Alphaproteobacteria bacterium]